MKTPNVEVMGRRSEAEGTEKRSFSAVPSTEMLGDERPRKGLK
jgi:hypothetical protein